MQLYLDNEEKEKLIRTLCGRCDLDLKPKIDAAMERKQLDTVLQLNRIYEINQIILQRIQGL